MSEKVLFFQDPVLEKHWREYLFNGVRRFLYTVDVPEEAFLADMAVVRREFRNRRWEVARETEDGFALHARGREPVPMPRFRLADGTGEELEAALSGAPRYLFVRTPSPPPGSGNKNNYKLRREVRERVSMAGEMARDEGVVAVAFGPFRFALMFSPTFQGCAVRAYAPVRCSPCFRVTPDGSREQVSPLKGPMARAARHWAAFLRSHHKLDRPLVVGVLRAIMSIQATPHYQERLLSLKRGQEYDPVTLLPPSFFVEGGASPAEFLRRDELPLLNHALPGDRVTCDTCSLRYRCSLYQRGGVCVMPGTDGKALADFFGSRDADDVVKGLRAVLRKRAERVEGAVEAEDEVNEGRAVKGEPKVYSDQVTKMLGDLQRGAESFLKLTDPRFARGPLVQINQQNNMGPSPHAPALGEVDYGEAIDKLVEMGFEREAITPEDVQRVVEGRMLPGALAPGVIEGDVGF